MCVWGNQRLKKKKGNTCRANKYLAHFAFATVTKKLFSCERTAVPGNHDSGLLFLPPRNRNTWPGSGHSASLESQEEP